MTPMVSPSETPTDERAEAWSIRRVLAWAFDDFRRRGLASPRLDAELLLGAAVGLDRIALIVQGDKELSAKELGTYRDLIKRRRKGEPIAYILGKREFFGHEFRVDRRVLVPRPDTECLVEVALELTQARDMHGRALDLCTGSGAVAIAFAKARPTWNVTATDIDPAALDVARDNVLRLGAFNVALRQGDLFGAVPPDASFELVTANPPYIPHDDIAGLDVDIRDFEPHLALDGGAQGLDFIERAVTAAKVHLARGGVLALEIGSDQAAAVRDVFASNGYIDVEVRRDYGGHDRVVFGRL
jgi:release factor glutamine methyltransferase